jgi:hypothetical protein
MKESVEYQGPGGATLDLHVIRTRTNKFRIEVVRPGAAPIIQAFDGRVGWQAQPEWGMGLMPYPLNDPWFWQNDLFMPARAFGPGSPHTAMDGATVSGRPCLVARVPDASGIDATCYFDRGSHQLIRYVRPVGQGSPGLFVAEFGDFGQVEGLTVPFWMKVTLGSQVAVHRRSRITINPPLDESSFVLSTAQLQEAQAINAILERHEASIGTPAALGGIRSRVTHVNVEVPNAGLKCSETISQKGANLILEEIRTPGIGEEDRGFDGTTGWAASELQGYRPLKRPELAQLMRDGSLNLLVRLGQAYPFRRRLGDRALNGRPTIAVALAGFQGPAGTFYFDKENGRLLRIASKVLGDRANSTESSVDFSDFRTIEGLEIPFVLVQTSPLMKATLTVQSVENNPTLDDAIFRPRRDE